MKLNVSIILILIMVTMSCKESVELSKNFQRIKYNDNKLIVDLGVGLWAWPIPTDYDNDGDYDLLVNCPDKPYNGIYFFENSDGNVKMPIFKPGVKISKAYWNIQPSYINGEIKLLIPGKEITNLIEGQIIEIYPDDEIDSEGKKIRANQWKYCDYDGDDALDLIVSVGDWTEYGWDNAYDKNGDWQNGPLHGHLYLIKNKSTTNNPEYEKPKLIFADNSPIDIYGMPSANFEDFDNDGDLDIICGEFLDKFTYFENIGDRNNPKYSSRGFLTYSDKPITMDLEMIIPVAFDWDKDGDIDLVVGQEDGRVVLVENTGTFVNNIPQFKLPIFFKQKADDIKFGALVTPFNIDWDNDGDDDLICGNTAGYIGFIENLNGENPPKWAEPVYLQADDEVIRIQAGYNGSIQGPCEAKWGYTTLSVGDWDHDGLHDIIINSIWGKILWYKNFGTKNDPKLAAAKPIKVEWKEKNYKPAWYWWEPEGNNLATQWRTTPLIYDWNNDDLMDLIMLDHEGFLAFFERSERENKLILLPGKRIFYNEQGELLQLNPKSAGKSGRRKLSIVDWDLDGKLDLLVNSKNVNFFKNISTSKDKVVFKDMGMVSEQILAGHTTSPTTVDWDKNGIPDLLLGAEDGYFYYLRNPNK
ncbi:MAG: VCBS repeat-containing protein [Bacteroidota bacterium]